jgi:uncharacterized membrane protein (UPF0127 family)
MYKKVRIGSAIVNAEIADSIFKKMKGLMGRKTLKESEGMLFPFRNENYHKFSMLFMSIPIDIIFVNKNKKIVDIFQNVQPCFSISKNYTPKEKAKYVLEVKANFTKRHSIKIGSKVDFE